MNDRSAKIGVWAYLLFTLASFALALYLLLAEGGYRYNVSLVALPVWMGYTAFNTIKQTSLVELFTHAIPSGRTNQAANIAANVFARARSVPRGPILSVHNKHRHAAAGRIKRHTEPGCAGANYGNVKLILPLKTLNHLAAAPGALLLVHVSCHFLWSSKKRICLLH